MNETRNNSVKHDLTSVRRTPGGRLLAPYAADANSSRGRLIDEPSSATRTAFQRDRDRVIHSDAFRRLKHKTQVFVHHEGDHYRTRLTHTIEVGQIARALARALKADEDLAECLALVHDFGHPPFGHAGERVLATKMAYFGGFDHNAQALSIVTDLEKRYAGFDGLNLTWETLEGLVKHNGPLTDTDGKGLHGPVPQSIVAYNKVNDLWLWSWPSVEAQCAAIADDIAYDNHDLDDGLRAGLFNLDDLSGLPLSQGIVSEIKAEHPGLAPTRMNHELVRRQITAMVEDVINESLTRIEESKVENADEVRKLNRPLVSFSAHMLADETTHKAFMFERMYRHHTVMAAVEKAENRVGRLFDRYMEDNTAMPNDEHWSTQGLSENRKARKIADYIAGMTDRFADAEHARLFDRTGQTR